MSDLATYSFTKLVVHDLDAMVRFYGDVYGLTELQRVSASIAGEAIDEVILASAQGAYSGLILLSWPHATTPAPAGSVIVGFTTTDIEALFARAVAAGATVREAPAASPAAPGFIVGFLVDPEGHLTEVVQPIAAG